LGQKEKSMLQGMPQMLPQILHEMEVDDSISFHLTGSRLFGGASVGSDWDFFTEAGSCAGSFLKTHGFIPLKKYPTDTSYQVYAHPQNVHVILKPPLVYQKVLNLHSLLQTWPDFHKLPKDMRKRIFEMAYLLNPSRVDQLEQGIKT